MERTQVYLTEQQKQELAVLSEHTGESQAVLIRQALDEFLQKKSAEKMKEQKMFMKEYAGMWADRDDLDGFVDRIRAQADSRLAGLHGGLSEPDQAPYQPGPIGKK
jgi:hypothetical protein